MRNYSQPLHPVFKNMLILLSSGLVASVLCAKVYGATPPADEPTTVATQTATAGSPASAADAAAAASLRAMLAGQRPLAPTYDTPRR